MTEPTNLIEFPIETRRKTYWRCVGCGVDNPCDVSVTSIGPATLTIRRTCMCDQKRAPHWQRMPDGWKPND